VLRPGGRVVVADIVAGNPVFNTLKHIYRSWNPDADYGEDPDLDEYREFFAGLEDVRLEPRCLLEGVKRLLTDRTRRSAYPAGRCCGPRPWPTPRCCAGSPGSAGTAWRSRARRVSRDRYPARRRKAGRPRRSRAG
jgi:hypothetical protein